MTECIVCGCECRSYINGKEVCDFCFIIAKNCENTTKGFITFMRNRSLFDTFVELHPTVLQKDNFGRSFIDVKEVERILNTTYKPLILA